MVSWEMESGSFLSENPEHRMVAAWDAAEALTGSDRVEAFRHLMLKHDECSFTQKHSILVMERLRCQFTNEDAISAMVVLIEMGVELLANQIPHLFAISSQTRQQMLARRLDCQFRDTLGNSALHVLAYSTHVSQGMEENWKELLCLGLDPRARNDNGDTPMSLARQNGHYDKVAMWVGEFESGKVVAALERATPIVGRKSPTSRL
jgi:hypothetical protein